jgi:hypothetical protein
MPPKVERNDDSKGIKGLRCMFSMPITLILMFLLAVFNNRQS